MNKASVISKGETAENLAPPQLPQSWSPSAIRKMNSEMHAKRVNLNLCYLGEQQAIGLLFDTSFRHQCDLFVLSHVSHVSLSHVSMRIQNLVTIFVILCESRDIVIMM